MASITHQYKNEKNKKEQISYQGIHNYIIHSDQVMHAIRHISQVANGHDNKLIKLSIDSNFTIYAFKAKCFPNLSIEQKLPPTFLLGKDA